MSLVVLITGCSSGFGFALAKEALQRGFRVIATARKASLSKLAPLEQLGAKCLELDITSSQEILETFAAEAVKVFNCPPHILINNAGIVCSGNLEEFNQQQTDLIFKTNMHGPMNVTRAFLPYFRKARTGVLAFISSESGTIYEPGLGLYCMTKAAIDMYCDSLRTEVKPLGISVVTINPGEFDTDIGQKRLAIDESQRITDYASADMDSWMHTKRPGTAEAAAKRMLDVLTLSGTASDFKELPARFALGADAIYHIKTTLNARLKELEGALIFAQSQVLADDFETAWAELGKGSGLAQLPTYANE